MIAERSMLRIGPSTWNVNLTSPNASVELDIQPVGVDYTSRMGMDPASQLMDRVRIFLNTNRRDESKFLCIVLTYGGYARWIVQFEL